MDLYRRQNVLAVAMVSAALSAVLSGCGASSLPADQVSSTIVAQLKSSGVTVDNDAVTCPGDLPPEVGQTMRCGFTAGGQPADAVATVSSVDGRAVNFNVVAEARPVPKAVLERVVTEEYVKSGLPIEKVTCAGELQPQVGQTQRCTLTGGGEDRPLTTTVTEVRSALVMFTIQQS